jgi:hypothetical protein
MHEMVRMVRTVRTEAQLVLLMMAVYGMTMTVTSKKK